MNTLVVDSDPALKATFHSRRFGSDGWLDSYILDLEAIDFRASVNVQNPGYGQWRSIRRKTLLFRQQSGSNIAIRACDNYFRKSNHVTAGHFGFTD